MAISKPSLSDADYKIKPWLTSNSSLTFTDAESAIF